MKKDHYKATLKKIQKSLESSDQKQDFTEIERDIAALKKYIPERMQFLDKVIKSMGPDGQEVNHNAIALLKQAPHEIVQSSERVLKNSQQLAPAQLQSLIKEFNSISKEYAANYIDLLERNGIK